MKNLTIGQLAKETGTHVETIRYYERRGLIAEPPRRASGYREFPSEYVERIRFIKHAQALGFTLREISELLALADGNPACKDVRRFAEEKAKDIETRIHDLHKIKEVLHELIKKCLIKGQLSGCPIIESLTQHKIRK
ncbi:Hg(II)-responsive transcriptional regulator [uncultured Candidatus Kuenenia sp.]|jgi:MerR family mercuric resistance operon transcriptional regulator|uniref:Hg(II)-responsive transcriptional regulator n=1 Tax=uncultured Candidatus Kuenenia sp. TaxID=1048336 RepID=UPI0002F7B3A3|nr:Hg(II)-responsive transcriptional regulator [uncultured Candidatus Kuenenia sp.]